MTSDVVLSWGIFYFISGTVVVEVTNVKDLGMYVDDIEDERRMWRCREGTSS